MTEHSGCSSALPPMILTLELEPSAFAHFEALRQQYFPAARNLIPAHLTLFHKLPGEEEAQVAALLKETGEQHAPMLLHASEVMQLGRGVAYRVDAPALQALHAGLVRAWEPWLTPQDRQGFRPHVVVQNKVEPADARSLHAQLAGEFRPFTVEAIGLHLWRYLGGRWESLAVYPFLGG